MQNDASDSKLNELTAIIAELAAEVRQLRAEVAALRTAPQAGATALTVEAAAQRLGCGRSRVFELLAEGKLQPAAKHGRKRMVTLESVDQLLATGVPPKRVVPKRPAPARIPQARQRVAQRVRPVRRRNDDADLLIHFSRLFDQVLPRWITGTLSDPLSLYGA